MSLPEMLLALLVEETKLVYGRSDKFLAGYGRNCLDPCNWIASSMMGDDVEFFLDGGYDVHHDVLP